MSEWKIAMLCLLPLMFGGAKPRTWGAVMGSSVMAMFLPMLPAAYLVIDIACGGLVLVRPAGTAQRAIGLLFSFMAIIDLGYLLSPQLAPLTYYWTLSVLGWGQFAILACWGAYDTGKAIVLRYGPRRHLLAVGAGSQCD